uniref:Uncharacterized protein n=1 Tax=Cacopsylla melanoneura TaxID=428564 RepID=A0A8D8SP03_9HEMI
MTTFLVPSLSLFSLSIYLPPYPPQSRLPPSPLLIFLSPHAKPFSNNPPLHSSSSLYLYSVFIKSEKVPLLFERFELGSCNFACGLNIRQCTLRHAQNFGRSHCGAVGGPILKS